MSYDEKALMKYGSTKQKNQLKSKMAYDKTVSEVEWRKEAVKGWTALLKHAELGMSSYTPNDALVIGALGENCFDSFREYKELQVKTAHDFNTLAKSMIAMNESMVKQLTKVACTIVDKGVDGLQSATGMVKKASVNKKYISGEEVSDMIGKIAKSAEWVKFAADIREVEKVSVSDVKSLFANNAELNQGLKRIVT